MATDIRIIFDNAELAAQLDDSATAAAIAQVLPLECRVNRWGDEFYFTIPVQIAEAADTRQDMRVGELAYWPVGAAFCIFFGPTPVSTGAAPRAYSNVNPFGRIMADEARIRSLLATVSDGDVVHVVAV